MSTGRSGPLVFAHRGSSEALPEHTLAAYLRALDEGADGLECDVRLTRDGHLVCVHDRRLNRTSNGRGRVSRHTLAELNALDFGSWHRPTTTTPTTMTDRPPGTGPRRVQPPRPGPVPIDQPPPEPTGPDEPATLGPDPGDDPPDPDRTRLLTLGRLLDAVRDAGREVRLLVETKHPSRYGPDVERRVVMLLRRYGLAEPVPGDPVTVSVMSFSPLAIRRVRLLAPELPTVLLLEVLPPGIPLNRLPFGAHVAGPGMGLIRTRPGLLPALRTAGHPVYAWTVNRPADLELVLAGGVSGVITDRPRMVLDRLGR